MQSGEGVSVEEGETDAVQSARHLLEIIRDGYQSRLRVARIVPSHRLEDQRTILDRAGHRADRVQSPCQGADASVADTADGRSDAGDAVVAGPAADRASGVAPHRAAA